MPGVISFQERSPALGRVQLPSRRRRCEGKFRGLDASSSYFSDGKQCQGGSSSFVLADGHGKAQVL